MKIALVDNMNNSFFSMARYFKDEKLDVTVYQIPNSSMDHFTPKSDTFINVENIKFLKYFPVDIKNKTWLFFNEKLIHKEFQQYDIIFSCGLSSAYLIRARIKIDIMIPYGSDLYSKPFKKIKFSFDLSFIRSVFHNHQAKYQKEALKDARVLITDDGYYLYKDALNKLKIRAFNLGVPMLYNQENLDVEENKKIWNYLEESDFIVFNHSRQHWLSDNPPGLKDYKEFGGLKRNDKLIKAFSLFVKKTKFKNPMLVLFEYGTDIDNTKLLIDELGLEKFVKWMPTMRRKNIMFGLSKATFSSNAFRNNLNDIGGVCYESFACSSSHLNNCKEVIQDKNHKFFNSPMIHALTEDDILSIFIDYENNPDKYKKIGEKSKEWFDENLGIGLAKKYIKLIKLLASDKKLNQNNKKVREIFEG